MRCLSGSGLLPSGRLRPQWIFLLLILLTHSQTHRQKEVEIFIDFSVNFRLRRDIETGGVKRDVSG